MLSTEVYDFMRQENYIFMNIHLFWKQLLMCSKCSMQCNEMYQCNKMRQWNVWHSPNYECPTKSRSSAAVNILRALCQTLHFSFLLSWKNKPKSFVYSTWLNRSRQKNTSLRLIPVEEVDPVLHCAPSAAEAEGESSRVSVERWLDTATHTAGAGDT